MFIKIENGYAKLYSVHGTYVRTIGEQGAASGVVQGDTIAVTYVDGRVRLYNMSGTYLRTL